MATTFNVQLQIGSNAGFRWSWGSTRSPIPTVQTLLDLEGNSYASTGVDRTAPTIVIVTPLNDFPVVKGNNSEFQTFEIQNTGNADLIISDIIFSEDGVTPVYDPFTFPITIPPTGTFAFDLAYIGTDVGEFVNFFNVISNIASGFIRIITRQVVSNVEGFVIDTDNYISTITELGSVLTFDYDITPNINLVPRPDIIWSTTATIVTADPGWSILPGGNNVAHVRFSSNAVNNTTGTYTATFEIVANEISVPATARVDVDIDFSQYATLGSWTGPASPDNSIVAISYDLLNGQKYITIGVGMGADNTTEYSAGGAPFANVSALGYAGGTSDYPFTAWSTVYRIPLSGSPTTYFSGSVDAEFVSDYKVKSTEGYNYEDYFGSENDTGSMFIVTEDAHYNVSIRLNSLRELTGDAEFDRTLKNLTRAFYYHSTVDLPYRLSQLEASPLQNGYATHLFNGFNNSGTVLTSIVPLPISF